MERYKIYACSLLAFLSESKPSFYTQPGQNELVSTAYHSPIAIAAASDGIARAWAMDQAVKIFPPAEGYDDHHVQIVQVDLGAILAAMRPEEAPRRPRRIWDLFRNGGYHGEKQD